MLVPNLLLPPKIIKMFVGPKRAIFAPKYDFLGTYRPCWLIWCPFRGLVGCCGARAALSIERLPTLLRLISSALNRVVAGREGLKLISNIHVFFPLLLSLQTLFLLVMAALARSDNTQPAKPMNNIQSPSCINVYSKPLKAAGLKIFSCQAILFYVPRWLWKNWEAGKISALKMDLDQVRQILRYSNIHTVDLYQIQQIFKHSYIQRA